MPKIRTSRRVPPLKDSDYDHEITLVDDSPADDARSEHSQTSARGHPALDASDDPTPQSGSPGDEPAPTGNFGSQNEADSRGPEQDPVPTTSRQVSAEAPSTVPILNRIPPTPSTQLDTGGANAGAGRSPSKRSRRLSKRPTNTSRASRASIDSEIDILYENERGGILCGIPLFSSKALGNLDPSPWTNIAHKPSPTNINTATVPDPSWEWSWPEWKVNHDVGVDKDGWEYSFMFSKKFSWHGPKWWNSFVRRRAWIRRRIRKKHRDNCNGHTGEDPCLLNTDYFTVRPASESLRSRSSSMTSRLSRMSSKRGSRTSLAPAQADSAASIAAVDEIPDIADTEMLLAVLKCSRIDREKIEAVENYLENGGDDLDNLQRAMHDIMSLFVFQSSRQILLSRLMQVFDDTKAKQKKEGSAELEKRARHLSDAIKHADEEVRKLEYWSDIKGMAERGEASGAVDSDRGWDDRFRGLDKSAPAPPPKAKPNEKGDSWMEDGRQEAS